MLLDEIRSKFCTVQEQGRRVFQGAGNWVIKNPTYSHEQQVDLRELKNVKWWSFIFKYINNNSEAAHLLSGSSAT